MKSICAAKGEICIIEKEIPKIKDNFIYSNKPRYRDNYA